MSTPVQPMVMPFSTGKPSPITDAALQANQAILDFNKRLAKELPTGHRVAFVKMCGDTLQMLSGTVSRHQFTPEARPAGGLIVDVTDDVLQMFESAFKLGENRVVILWSALREFEA